MATLTSEKQGMAAYRAPSLFQPHQARKALRDAHEGKIPPLLGLYLGLSAVPNARFVAPMAFDAVWVDWEHSSCNVETMTSMVHELIFMSEGKTIPFVRVPGHDHAAIGYALDAGASIVIPQVETVEQAQFVVSSAKFGTKSKGTRSAPPFRLIPGLTDMSIDSSKTLHQNLNEQAAVMIQIETLEGINNLDAILTAVPDIDAVWLGTLDARISMNLPGNGGMGGTEQEWVDAVATYENTMKKHNKPSAGFAIGDKDTMIKMGKGKSFLMVTADVMGLAGLAGGLQAAREVYAIPGKGDSNSGSNGTV
ncbi:MAG: hypothetical protein M1812_002969 [Candelaria pacifica]|nr:MAG: hypothetical protein M1812_002969 [Candelaria pacifica]